jgi:hypothetical protein
MRRSCSHLMAVAVDQLWPRAKFGVGPAIDNGFFYDIELPETFSSRISRRSSSRCASSRTRGCRSSVMELATDEAIAVMEKLGQRYKVELLGLLKEKGSTAVAKDTGDDAVGRGCGRCPDRLTLQERRFCRSCGAVPRVACGRDQPFQADPTRSWQHGLSRGPRAISQVRSPTCRTW